jgi:hypothetical protein
LETLFGVHDQNIKYLESLLDVRIDARGQDVSIDGDPADVETAQRILEDFSDLFKEGKHFTDKELREAFAQIAEDRAFSLRDYFTKTRFNPAGKKQVAPKSANQRKYIQAYRTTTSCSASASPAPARRTSQSRWRSGVDAETGEPHRARAPGGRSRREARLPARRSAGQSRSVPATHSTTRSSI